MQTARTNLGFIYSRDLSRGHRKGGFRHRRVQYFYRYSYLDPANPYRVEAANFHHEAHRVDARVWHGSFVSMSIRSQLELTLTGFCVSVVATSVIREVIVVRTLKDLDQTWSMVDDIVWL